MIAPKKTNIYICDSIDEGSETFKAIKDNVSEDVDCDLCKIIRNQDLAVADESKCKEIRFGCVTPQTPSHLTNKLLTKPEAIPILLIGNEGTENYEMVLVSEHKIDREDMKRMIYNVNSPTEIKGAIKWVHNYYYQMRELEKRMMEKMARLVKEMGKQIAASSFV